MSPSFGGPDYTQPSTRELSQITETPNPEASDYADAGKFAAIVQRHDYELKALAQQTQQLQQGVNDATQNPIQQIQQFIADVVVLLGGGEITQGVLDFGDLQYILPTLGALFGLGDAPFPIDLFQAAEKFFFGYVVPNQQFTDEINTIISNWLTLIGIDPQFIKDLKALITAVGELFGEVGNILPSLASLFGELGISANDLGPLGQILAPIIKFFSGLNLQDIGSLLEFVTNAIDPFVKDLTAVINFINSVLAVLGFDASGGGGVTNSPLPQLTEPFENLIAFLKSILSVFGLGSDLTADNGLDLGNLLSIPATFLNDLLSGLGLGDLADGAGPLVTLIQDLLSGNIQGVIDTLVSFLSGGATTTGDVNVLSGLLKNLPLVSQLLDPSTGSFFPNLIGRLSADLLPQLSIGSLTTAKTNLLAAPNFADAASIVGQGIWSYDPDTNVPAPPDWELPNTPGAVSVYANGVTNTLFSNVIQLAPGDVVKEGISTVWEGLASTGSPIQLVARVYDVSKNILDTPVLASVTSPPANGSQILSGSYTAPEGAAYITMGLRVLGSATAGTVKFGKGSWSKSNKVPGESVLGLSGIGSTIVGDLESVLSGAISELGGGGGGDLIAEFVSLLSKIPGTNVLGLSGSGSSIVQDLENLLSGGIASLGGTPSTNLIAQFVSLLTNIPGTNVAGLSCGTGNIVSDVGSLINNVVNQLTGNNATGWGLPDLSYAVGGQASTTAANSAAIAELQAQQQQVQNGGGTAESVNFSGSLPSSFTPQAGINVYAKPTQTNNQIIAAVWSSLPSGGVQLIGRSTVNASSYVYAQITSSQVTLGCISGGSHSWASASARFQAGAIYALYCGVPGNSVNAYQLFCNGHLILSFIDSGQAAVGASNLSAGYQQASGYPQSWSLTDNAPPAVIGSTFRANRTSTGTVSISSGTNILPANYFQSIARISPDLSFNLATNGLTVTTPGTYMVCINYMVSNISNSSHLNTVLFRNGAIDAMGGGGFSGSIYSSSSNATINGVFLVLCNAGDILQPGIYADTTGDSITGEASGGISYMTATLVNRSLL